MGTELRVTEMKMEGINLPLVRYPSFLSLTYINTNTRTEKKKREDEKEASTNQLNFFFFL